MTATKRRLSQGMSVVMGHARKLFILAALVAFLGALEVSQRYGQIGSVWNAVSAEASKDDGDRDGNDGDASLRSEVPSATDLALWNLTAEEYSEIWHYRTQGAFDSHNRIDVLEALDVEEDEDLAEGDKPQLPRTSTREYNQMQEGERYLLYSPSGGFNNQLITFLSSAGLARKLNRTLIVPPAGRHSDMEAGYYRQLIDEVVAMDRVLNFAHLERSLGVSLLPLNMTLRAFHEDVLGGGNRNSARVYYPRWQGGFRAKTTGEAGAFTGALKSVRQPVVFCKGRWYNNKYMSIRDFAKVQYAPYLVALSRLIADELLGSDFDAVHVRLGDYAKASRDHARDGGPVVKLGLKSGLTRERPLYLASDGAVYDANTNRTRLSPWFRSFKVFRNLTTQARLAESPRVAAAIKDFRRRMPPSVQLRQDTFGLVEQMLCARSRTFLGTRVSTFSLTIWRMRLALLETIPDLAHTRSGEVADGPPWPEGVSVLSHWGRRSAGGMRVCLGPCPSQ